MQTIRNQQRSHKHTSLKQFHRILRSNSEPRNKHEVGQNTASCSSQGKKHDNIHTINEINIYVSYIYSTPCTRAAQSCAVQCTNVIYTYQNTLT